MEGRPETDGQHHHQRHHRQRPDRNRQSNRILGPNRTAFESKAKVRSFIDVGRLTKGALTPAITTLCSLLSGNGRGFQLGIERFPASGGPVDPAVLIRVDSGGCLGVRGSAEVAPRMARPPSWRVVCDSGQPGWWRPWSWGAEGGLR